MLLHHESCVYLLPVGIISLPVVKGNMHALNEYYYVKGDPGDKVCFPKHIIKPATGTYLTCVQSLHKKIYMGVTVLGAILYT